MTKPLPKNTRGRGRPRNPELDRLMRELAVTRRHAASLLKEQKNIATPAKSGTPTPATGSPIGFARLAKLLKETELLESKVRQALLDERIRDGELLTLDSAKQLFCLPLQTIRDQLATLPKRFAIRLFSQPIKTIETTLADECDRIVSLARKAVEL
jgi:hypothetical protein